MAKQKDVVEHISDEMQDSYSDDDLESVSSWGADLSFRELVQRYTEGDLIKPELQRKYVWDKTEASRFIESILIGLPVPSIFLAKTQNEKMLIVDGYQRIMTVYDYIRGLFAADEKVFRLSRSPRINKRWQGKAFNELSENEQRRIKTTTIHAIIFTEDKERKDSTSLNQIFERINTSGRTLMPQEIRNCVSQGSFNTLLLSLNKNVNWRNMFGLQEDDSRMRDLEFILRFFALSSEKLRTEDKDQISLKKFLDVYMHVNRNADAAIIESMRKRFEGSINLLYETFGKVAYQNVSSQHHDKLVPKFSPTVFDSLTIAADHAIAKGNYKLPEKPEEARRALLTDEDYRSSISQETMRTDNIRKRISFACNLFGITYE